MTEYPPGTSNLEKTLTEALQAAEAERDRLRILVGTQEKWAIEPLMAERDRLAKALREVVNLLGPDTFAGEPEGLIAEGNEALRVARAALAGEDT